MPEVSTPQRFAVERRTALVERLNAAGRIDVSEVARDLGVTSETVRRDLAALAGLGILRRVHGGAVPATFGASVPDFPARSAQKSAEKSWIGAAAGQLIPRQGGVFIDSGSTAMHLVNHVPRSEDLTIVTNSLPFAAALAPTGRAAVRTLGGLVRGPALAEIGSWAIESLSALHLDAAFVAVSGVDLDHGFSTPTSSEAQVKRSVISAADRVIVMCDSSKLGARYLERFAELEDVDVLLTDVGAPRELLSELRDGGLTVIVCGKDGIEDILGDMTEMADVLP